MSLGVCFTGEYILQDDMQEGMYFWKTCLSAGHVFYESICYGKTCEVGGHVLQFCAKVTI